MSILDKILGDAPGGEPDEEVLEDVDDMTDVDQLPPELGGPDEPEPEVEEVEEVEEPDEVEEPVASVTEPEPEPEPEPDEEAIVAQLRQEVQRLNQLLVQRQPAATEAPTEETTEEQPVEQPRKLIKPGVKLPTEPVQFLTEDEANDVMLNPEKLNDLFNKVRLQAIQDTLAVAPEAMLTTVGEYARYVMVQEDFLGRNEDLVPFAPTLQGFIDQVEKEHVDWSYKQKLEEAGARTRKALAMASQAENIDARASKPPNQPKVRSRARPAATGEEDSVLNRVLFGGRS